MNTQFIDKTNNYAKTKRIIALLAAMTLWLFSIIFNTDGFSFQIPERAWMGIVFGIIVTVMQFIGNSIKWRENLTLFVMCMISYVFSIYMDMVGIAAAMHIPLELNVTILFPLLLGIFIEVTPEPLVIKALNLKNREGDLLGNWFGIHPKEKPQSQQPPVKKPPYQPVPTMKFNYPDPDVLKMQEKVRQENLQRIARQGKQFGQGR